MVVCSCSNEAEDKDETEENTMKTEDVMRMILKSVQEGTEPEKRSSLADFIYDSDYSEIGNCVLRKTELSKRQVNNAIAICRRSFTKDDIILFDVLDEEEEGEEGIVFTEKAIYHWLDNETVVGEVPYEMITGVDYGGAHVTLWTTDDEAVDLYCGEDAEEEKYTRYMYNFISDILDFFEKEEKSGKRKTSKETQKALPGETQEVLLLSQRDDEPEDEIEEEEED